MTEYTPAGRPQAFTVPATTDAANLITILQAFADDTMNAHGDTVTGNYTITGTVNMSAPQKAGVALITASSSDTLTNKILQSLGAIWVCTSGTRPGSPAQGQFIFETDTKKVWYYDSAWIEYEGGGGGGIVTSFLLGGM